MLNSKKGGTRTSSSDIRDGFKGTGCQLVKDVIKGAALLNQTVGVKVSFLQNNMFTVVGFHCRRASVEVWKIAVSSCFWRNNRVLVRRVRRRSWRLDTHRGWKNNSGTCD